MARKVIIDCDPGIDDAVALTMALFDPQLEVIAVTAVAGSVSADQATRNVQAVIEQLDPPRYPRIGAATANALDGGRRDPQLHGEDGLGNSGFHVSELHHQHPSAKLITDEIRAAPDEVTVMCLGPLTNLALAFQRDPELAMLVNRIIIMGGSVHGVGNVTPAAEFNIFYDPPAARSVFRSPTTKLLVPLDLTRQIKFPLGIMDQLPSEQTRAGAFLRRVLPHLFRSYHLELGQESVYLHGAVAITVALEAGLCETSDMAGDVELEGELTTGATIFDRRPLPQWRPNVEVALHTETAAISERIIAGLNRAAR